MTANGNEVVIEGAALGGNMWKGTLRDDKLEIPNIPGEHHYSENRITFTGPMATSWTRLDDGPAVNGGGQWEMPLPPTAPVNNGWAAEAKYQEEPVQPPVATFSGWEETQPAVDYSQTNYGGYGDTSSQPATQSQPDSWSQSNAWGQSTETAAPAQAENAWGNWTQPEPSAANVTVTGWGNYGGTNSGGNEAASWEDAEQRRWDNYWKEFQTAQEWFIQQGKPPGTNFSADPFQNCREMQGQGEDFNLYESVAVTVKGEKAENAECLTTFQDMEYRYQGKVPEALFENMRKCGFNTPTPVQKYAIPIGLAGRDVMCMAQTGSGKTASFLIPMLASMIAHRKAIGDLEQPFVGPCKPDTLILTPTRELCIQTYEDALRFCYNTPHRCYRVYGQQSAKSQILELAKGADLIVATVGRVYDFVKAGVINLEEVNCLVFDEADRMLDMGFQEQIQELVMNNKMPSKECRQTMMFSATFPEAVANLAEEYLHQYLHIICGRKGSPAVTVTQIVERVEKDKKLDKLKEVIQAIMTKDKSNRILLFCNSKNAAKFLDQELWDQHIASTAAIHGDLEQTKREQSLAKFRDGLCDVMIATDVASRGLDISRVSHVVNYDAPKEISLYVHRIGRTGRIGHRGTSMTFITMEGGWCMDSEEFLQELPEIMQGAPNTEVPDWLKELSNDKTGAWPKKNDWGTDLRESNGQSRDAWNETSKDSKDAYYDSWGGNQETKQNSWDGWTTGNENANGGQDYAETQTWSGW